jgi:DNA-binding HxlR family transcriptional regulator
MRKKDELSKSYTINVLKDLLHKESYITELAKEKKYSTPILQNTLEDLVKSKLVMAHTKKLNKVGNPRIIYSLTTLGLEVALKLEDINKILSKSGKGPSLEDGLNVLKSQFLEHVNAIDNVVRVKDGPRIADVYVKELHGKIKLKCELCDSESCIHANFAYSLPEVRELLEKYK